MLFADLVHLAAFHGGVLVVHIIELNLHDLDLRVLGQDRVQHLGLVVEGDAKVADPALLLEFPGCFVGPTALVFLVYVPVLRVHQIKIKIVHAAGGELLFKEGANILLLLEVSRRQLVGQQEPVPGIALDEAPLDGGFALSHQIAVRGIEIIEASFDKGVDHPLEFAIAEDCAALRQPHTAKAEISVDLREKGILDHREHLTLSGSVHSASPQHPAWCPPRHSGPCCRERPGPSARLPREDSPLYPAVNAPGRCLRGY